MKKLISAILALILCFSCLSLCASAQGEFSLSTDNGLYTVEGGVYTIRLAGTYRLNGVLEDGRIVIDADEDAKIELVLEGAEISCSYASPIEVIGAKELKIKAENGTENAINDLRSPASADEGMGGGNAAVSGDCDIVLCGKGSLVISAGCGHGIHSREKIEIKNLTLDISSVGTCIKGNEGVSIESGNITLVSALKSGIRTSDADVSSNGKQHGDVEISGGEISIYALRKGIHAENTLRISGGSIEVLNSYEGLEGNVVEISGGNIKLTASDDGINACSGNSFPLVSISGGYTEIETPIGDTDGIDSNGNFVQSGGVLLVKSACTSGMMAGSVDVDGSITVTGGTAVAIGGICELPENSCNAYADSQAQLPSGSYVLRSSGGNEILSFDLNKSCSGIWLCSESFSAGQGYELVCNGSAVLSWTQEQGTVGSAGFGGVPFGGRGGFGGDPGGNWGGNPGMPGGGGFGGNRGGFSGNPGGDRGEMPNMPEGGFGGNRGGMGDGSFGVFPFGEMPGEIPEGEFPPFPGSNT